MNKQRQLLELNKDIFSLAEKSTSIHAQIRQLQSEMIEKCKRLDAEGIELPCRFAEAGAHFLEAATGLFEGQTILFEMFQENQRKFNSD